MVSMASSLRMSALSAKTIGQLQKMPHQICYSEKYFDDVYEYRHVILPKDVASNVPQGRLMSEAEWRKLGVQQSRGWVHYMIHRPEPHILLFRRPKQQQPEQ